ncbi:Retinoic acid early transcript 1E [Lemmus lemmus]
MFFASTSLLRLLLNLETWLNIYCSMDGKPLLEYNNANKDKLVGSSGEVNSTKAWKDMTQTLEELGQEFRKKLLYIRPKTNNTKDRPALQVNMCCQSEIEQSPGASLLFTINKEENSILFYAKNMTWIELNPEARGVKKKLENDKELEKDLKKFSMGDCSHWLNEFLRHWTEIPRPTVKTLDTVQMSSNSLHMNVIIPVVFIITTVFFVVIALFWKKIVSCICGNHRGQHTPSAAGEPRPEESICMIEMPPLEGASPCCSSASSVI